MPKHGYYVFDASIPINIALFYGRITVGEPCDPGLTLEEAVKILLDKPGWHIIRDDGKVVLSYAQAYQPIRVYKA